MQLQSKSTGRDSDSSCFSLGGKVARELMVIPERDGKRLYEEKGSRVTAPFF